MSAFSLGLIGRRYELSSPHSTEEIYRRLAKVVGWPVFSERAIVGLYDRRGFQLRVNIWYRNSFQTILYGKLRAEGSATRIVCNARMSTFAIAFMTVWFSSLLLMGGAITLADFARLAAGDVSAENVTGVSAFALMLAFGGGLIYVCRLWARDEEPKLIAFLEETIDATPV